LKSNLESVQAWRGISVLAVVLYHLGFEARRIWDGTNATLLSPLDRFGFCGVDVFFVISGFIIAYTNFDKLGQPSQLGNYLWNRLSRIYPAYLLISMPSFVQGLFSHQLKWKSFLGCALLIWPYPFLGNPVAWSLSFEVGFYLLFSIAFCLPARFLPLLLAAWAACIFGDTDHWFRGVPPDTYLSFTVLNVAILLGATGALLIRKGLIIFPRVSMFLAATLFAVGCITCLLIGNTLTNDLPLRCAFLAVPAFLMIYGAVGDEIKHERAYPKWLLHVGDASYSIYLCHYQMIILAEVLVLSVKGQVNPIVWQTVTGLSAVATGLLLYRFVEKPIVRFLHRRSDEKIVASKTTEAIEVMTPITVSLALLETLEDRPVV
jgi:exopolysaccharide production protein ExoZ